jgi:BACON domain-containing protein
MRILPRLLPFLSALCLAAACTDSLCGCTPPFGALLRVTPDRLLDSAVVGSTTPRVMTLEVMNDGGGELRWRATIKHASPWLSMAPDTGTAGQTPAPQLQANPTGLVVGSYRDTVIVENRAGTGSLAVPVELRIYP